jgi:hypothetical protein
MELTQSITLFPSGATVSYRREGQTTIVTEPFTKVLYSQDSTWHRFSTPVNFGVTTQTDTVRIVAWINLPGDNVSYNDTAFMEVISVHTPAAPVVLDTIILYGSSVTLPAVSPDPVSWYPTIVSTVALHSGSTFTTPILFSNTTYWVEAVAGLPGGPSYPQGCPGPRVPLNVIVFGSPACDVGISTLTQPVSSVLLSNQEDVTIRVSNFGTVLQQNIPVSYQIDNQLPVTEMITTIIPPGFFLYYTFTTKANLSNAGQTYQLKTWTGLPCDSFFANDTVYASVTKLLPAYCQSSATMPTNTEITNVTGPGSLNNSSPSFGAMYTDFTTTVQPSVLSPGINYPMSITTSFAPGANINDSCHVKVWIDFNRDGVFDPVSELVFLHTTYSSNTVSGSIQIPATVSSGFTAMRIVHQVAPAPNAVQPCGSYPQGETEDYMVNIVNQLPCDAAMIQVSNQWPSVPAGMQLPVYVRFMNQGFNTIAAGALAVSYRLNSGAPVTVTYPGSLPSGALDSIVFPPVTIPAGTNTLCAYTTLACDSNPINDTICITLTGVASFTIPFTENFDSTNTFSTDPSSIWQHGVPNGTLINTAFSSPNAWVTNLSGNYPNNSNSYLYSPVFNFSGLSGIDTITLSIRHYMAMQSGDYGRVQYSNNGGQSWSTLGFYLDMLGSNWYNATSGGLHYFSQTNSGWVQSSYKLIPATFNGMPQVQFRFHFYSNASGVSEGWAIDNFTLSFEQFRGTCRGHQHHISCE